MNFITKNKVIAFIYLLPIVFVSCEDNPYESMEEPVTEISIKTEPQISYVPGEALNLKEMVMTLHRKGGKEDDIPYSDFDIQGIFCTPVNGTKLKLGDSEIRFKHVLSNLEIRQSISVNPPSAKDQDILAFSVKTPPLTTAYEVGEPIDLKDLSLILTFSRTGDIQITEDDFSYYNISSFPAAGTPFTADMTEIVITCDDFADPLKIKIQEDNYDYLYVSDFSAGKDGSGFFEWQSENKMIAEDGMLRSNITVDHAATGNAWMNDLKRPDFKGLVNGKTYKFMFEAKSLGNDKTIICQVSKEGGDYKSFLPESESEVVLTSDFEKYSIEFVMGDAEGYPIRLLFNPIVDGDITNFVLKRVRIREVVEE